MSVDVDAVNERLNGLVTLLQAVGVDSGDVPGMSKGVMPDARQLDDDQIEAIIRKLQQAQAEAPQIIAALEAHAEARSLGGNSKRGQGSSSRHLEQSKEEEDDDDDDDDEDDEGNYPMVGHGISDDISVVSDLTTPTVLAGVPVPDEEHYRDTLPPMIIGGGPRAPPMMVNPSKRKNLVSQIRPGMAGPSRKNVPLARNGAAASRRKNHSNINKFPTEPQHQQRQLQQQPRKSAPRSSSNRSTGEDKKLKKKKPVKPTGSNGSGSFTELSQRSSRTRGANDVQQSQGWNAFESQPRSQSKAPTVIDNDGFLVGESFDPFDTSATSNPFSSSAGDLAMRTRQAPPPPRVQGNRLASPHHDTGAPRRPRPSSKNKQEARPMQSNFSQLRGKPQGAASGGRPRRARRASLAM